MTIIDIAWERTYTDHFGHIQKCLGLFCSDQNCTPNFKVFEILSHSAAWRTDICKPSPKRIFFFRKGGSGEKPLNQWLRR